jgi:hypothetical protein
MPPNEAADEFERLLGERPHVLPAALVPKRTPRGPTTQGDEGAMLVCFVGGTRHRRGALLIPEIVRRCASPEIRFFVQVRKEGDTPVRQLRELAGLPHVTLHEGVLDKEAFYDVIARSVVLLPFHPASFRARQSGVLHGSQGTRRPGSRFSRYVDRARRRALRKRSDFR